MQINVRRKVPILCKVCNITTIKLNLLLLSGFNDYGVTTTIKFEKLENVGWLMDTIEIRR